MQVDIEFYVEDDGKDRDYAAQLRATMYERRGKDESAVGKATAASIQTIEATCLPILRMEPLSKALNTQVIRKPWWKRVSRWRERGLDTTT